MAVPTVTSISPGSGPPGTPVIVNGTGFTETTTSVKFGTVSAGTRFTPISAAQIVVYAPPGTGTQHITVTTPGATGGTSIATGADNFTYSASEGPPGGGGGNVPTVTSIVPSTATKNSGGDTVAVNGTGFTTTQAVLFGSALAQFTVVSDTVLSVITPGGSGTVDVSVVTANGVNANTAGDDYTYPAGLIPTITSFTPTSAGEWALITITGTNFLDSGGNPVVTSVTFTGAAATEVWAVFRITSSTELVTYVPEGAITGPIKVYSEAGSATSGTFTFLGSLYDYVQATADGKNSVHYTTYPDGPGTTANVAGDLWYQYGTGGNANVVTAQWVGAGGTSWTATTLSNVVVASLDAGAITTGYLSAARINALGNITASGTITGGAIEGATITGAILQTSSSTSANRIVIDGSSAIDRVKLYPGRASTNAAYLGIGTVSGGGFDTVSLVVAGPIIGAGTPPNISIGSVIDSNEALNHTHIILGATQVEISNYFSVGGNADVVGEMRANRVVSDSFVNATSQEGIWIQDNNTASRRHKIYFNSSTNNLGVYDHNGNAHFIQLSA